MSKLNLFFACVRVGDQWKYSLDYDGDQWGTWKDAWIFDTADQAHDVLDDVGDYVGVGPNQYAVSDTEVLNVVVGEPSHV